MKQSLSIPLLKKSICLIFFLAAVAFFYYKCGQLVSNYENIAQASWSLILAVSFLLFSLSLAVVVALVRPFWLILTVFGITSLFFPFFVGQTGSAWTVAIIFFIFLAAHSFFAIREISNQINFSIRPLTGMKFFLTSVLAAFVSVAFATGYDKEAQKYPEVIPPPAHETLTGWILDEVKKALEKEKKTAAEIRAAVSQTRQKIDETFAQVEKELAPVKEAVPGILGGLIFMPLQLGFFVLISLLHSFLLRSLFFLFKKTHFTRLEIEKREVERLRL